MRKVPRYVPALSSMRALYPEIGLRGSGSVALQHIVFQQSPTLFSSGELDLNINLAYRAAPVLSTNHPLGELQINLTMRVNKAQRETPAGSLFSRVTGGVCRPTYSLHYPRLHVTIPRSDDGHAGCLPAFRIRLGSIAGHRRVAGPSRDNTPDPDLVGQTNSPLSAFRIERSADTAGA
jgi:hypothetical protein